MAEPRKAKKWRKIKVQTKFTSSGGVTAASRHASEEAGHTMKGGSFPINDAADLERAKHDVGLAKEPAKARSWINKRAKDLGEPALGESKEKPKRRLSGLYNKRSVIRRAG